MRSTEELTEIATDTLVTICTGVSSAEAQVQAAQVLLSFHWQNEQRDRWQRQLDDADARQQRAAVITQETEK